MGVLGLSYEPLQDRSRGFPRVPAWEVRVECSLTKQWVRLTFVGRPGGFSSCGLSLPATEQATGGSYLCLSLPCHEKSF